jgi:hypothetical protein
LIHTVEAALALGGHSQVPSTPGSVLTCGLDEKYEINVPHTITISAIDTFSFQETNMGWASYGIPLKALADIYCV